MISREELLTQLRTMPSSFNDACRRMELAADFIRGDAKRTPDAKAFAEELRKWWSFSDRQMHTHSWHSREDFIERKLPELLAALTSTERTRPFYGAECPSYPVCEGGCGLGCTKEIERPLAPAISHPTGNIEPGQ